MYEFLQPDWSNILQTVVTAPILYLVIIVGIRIVGNRSTSSMNNFDWIVTVAIGGIFASTVILSKTNIWEGAFGISLLLALQYAVTKAVQLWEKPRKWLKATPQLLVYRGEYMRDNMKASRVIEGEVLAAIRQNGFKCIDDIYAVVLETNAQLSVIPHENDDKKGFSLGNVGGLPDGLKEDLQDRNEDEGNKEGAEGQEETTKEHHTAGTAN